MNRYASEKETSNLYERRYLPSPPWIEDEQLPPLCHCRAGSKQKIPFAFEPSNVQTDAVLHYVIERVITCAQNRGYTRSMKISVKEKVVRHAHQCGPWQQLVTDVLENHCKDLSASDLSIARKLLERKNSSRDAAERSVLLFELDGRGEIIAKASIADRLGNIML